MQVFAQKKDSLRYSIKDRRGDGLFASKNPFDLRDTNYLKRQVEYDPISKTYIIREQVGSTNYRSPMRLSMKEMMELESRRQERKYFQDRSEALRLLNQKVARPPMRVYDKLFDRIFGLTPGGLKVDIRPQGELNILAGYQGQNIKNPTLAERARRNGGFDFDMNANLNVNAQIGEKLKFPISYNTLSNLNFDNQLRLDYKGMDDEMIKSIEAGNIAFQSRGSLIPGAQNLFGIKTQLQFGKLFITGALANQRSQRQSLTLQGGAANNTFQKRLDDYEENRHFLLAQYFRNTYNRTMQQLPVVNSQVQLQRIEVWVTNRTGATTDVRDVVGLMDLGETQPHNPAINSLTNQPLPFNGANDLYAGLASDANARNPFLVNGRLLARGLRPVDDFEKTFARKLNPSEYYFNPQVGFVSLNINVAPDEVIGVAYQYTYNGRVFQVGEFSQDVALDSARGVQQVLFLKLLKATSQRPNLPIWQLMMKNVYSLDLFGGIQRENFQFNVLFEEPSGGLKRFLPESDAAVEGQPLLRILQLDRLNNRNDPQPDGMFDFIEGFTVLPQQGKVIFPVLEPFGRDLDRLAFNTSSSALKQKYVYYQLYDSIKAIAQTYANVNRFLMQGQAKTAGGSEISLNTFNVPPGSVTVSAGGSILREGEDFIVDYNLGTVRIINQGILSSGIPVQVSFENNIGFAMQQRGFAGLRLDYLANKKLSLGASVVRLGERPFFNKMNFGDDPIRNTMYGLDFSYRSDLPGLNRVLSKLPFYQPKGMSSINAYGEGAMLKPGHPPQIGRGENGLIYIDDFEGTRNNIDLRFPFVAWALASTPQGTTRFPEATLTDSVNYNFNRAKLAWYNIEPNLQDKNSANNPLRRNLAELSDPRVRQVFTNELFPQRTTNITDIQTFTFDLAYYPTERGPYNFENRPGQINAQGRLTQPRNRWGGIMRAIDQTDFETANIEFVEFWVQDPFILNPNSRGGKLFLNLGNVSEDILKDGRRFYENGLNTPTIPAAVDSTTTWGRTPVNPIQITQAFSNDPNDRPFQDVGFDGMGNEDERLKRQFYLNRLAQNFGTNSIVYQQALVDPSNDDYIWFRDDRYTAAGVGILGRYKNFNNPQGNSPVAAGSGQFTPAATLFPDNEDLNRDNTLNETEEYYEYEIDLNPGMNVSNSPYITDVKRVNVNSADGVQRQENWYLFRVPVRAFSRKVGNIPDFKSIRFVRMYMTDFEDSVVLRFARFDLVRNQWRQFIYDLDTTGQYRPINPTATGTKFNTLAVNLEENGARQPVNYVIPPGIERVQQLSNNGINLLQNEQALSMQVRNLQDGDARAVFKTLNMDIRQYGRISMFAHAESVVGSRPLRDGDLYLVVRLGQDFLNNFYEIKIPLKITPPGSYSRAQDTVVWPAQNNLDFALRELVDLKLRRNNAGVQIGQIYREQSSSGRIYSIMGNPNLGELRGFLVGVENAMQPDGQTVDAEVWINELRLSQLDERAGYAALGRIDMTLADLGTVSVSANMYTQGFGTIEQRVNERARDNLFQFDIAANIDAGKLLPQKSRLSIPVFASVNRTIRTPEFDPYDRDVRFKEKIGLAPANKRDSIRDAAIDQTTIKTLNLTNVRIAPGAARPKLWSLSNFDFSYSFTEFSQVSPLILENKLARHRGGVGYTYNGENKFKEPFKKLIRNRSVWLNWLRDFNFNLQPSLISFRADINRQFGEFVPRIVNSFDNKVERVDTTYDKFFTFDRFYNFRWDLTRSVNFDFTATNFARVDEPNGRIDNRVKKDSMWGNFFRGGRNTQYQQRAVFTYTLPLNKLPLTDWITARYAYATNYNWQAASLIARSLGNIIENTQDNTLNAEFDFARLYNKSRWLRALENVSPQAPRGSKSSRTNLPSNNDVKDAPQNSNPLGTEIPSREEVVKGKSGKERKLALRKWRQLKRDVRLAKRMQLQNAPLQLSTFERAVGSVVTMVKRVSVNYTENYRSTLPGFMDSSRVLGNNFRSSAPGLGYIFGKQLDTSGLNKFAQRGLMSRDTLFNFLFRQNFEQRLNIAAQIEPVKELSIFVTLDKSFNKDYSQLFKDTLGGGGRFRHLNPLAQGGFSVSYMAVNTLFRKFNPNEVSATFREFENNRIIISRRVAEGNPYWQALPDAQKFTPDGFARGYGRYAQDVLIPSFLAAYSGKDPNEVPLMRQSNPNIRSNPFAGILPKPNWRLTYTGLTRIPAIAEKFNVISIQHGYNSRLSMNSFNSALLFQDPFGFNAPGFIDTVSGNYIPFFLLPNLTLEESFDPLIGFDVTTQQQLNFKFEYRRSRQLSMSLVDFQLAESHTTAWNFGFGWRKRGFKLPFRLPGKQGKTLENDLNVQLNVSIRDNAISNSRLDQQNAYGTGGQKEISIQPAVDYVLNNRINIKFFFDQRRVIPYISTAAPITNTRAGIQFRIALAQ